MEEENKMKLEIQKLREEKKKLLDNNRMVSLKTKLQSEITRLKYPRLFGAADKLTGLIKGATKQDTRKGGKLVFKDSEDVMKKLGFK